MFIFMFLYFLHELIEIVFQQYKDLHNCSKIYFLREQPHVQTKKSSEMFTSETLANLEYMFIQEYMQYMFIFSTCMAPLYLYRSNARFLFHITYRIKQFLLFKFNLSHQMLQQVYIIV